MSNDLKYLMRSACEAYEAAGVQGENGAKAMREGLARIEELEAKLAKAVEALETISGPHNWASPHAGLGGSMDEDLRVVARATLALIKKDKTDE